MSSIYLQLALLALIFSGFGFLLHAFYFGDMRQRRLTRDLHDLQEEFERKESDILKNEEASQKAERVIQSLEKQLQQRAVELDHLKQLAARQDKAIEMLQKDAEEIRAAVSGSAKSVKSVQEALSSVAPLPPPPPTIHLEVAPAPPAPMPIRDHQQRPGQEIISPVQPPAQGHSDAPAWRENLDNILSILDTMEKEVDK